MAVNVDSVTGPAYSQVLLDEDFSLNDGSWTPGTGWAIGGGVATGTAATGTLPQAAAPLTSGLTYKIRIFVTATVGKVVVVAGSQVSAAIGGSASPQTFNITANGTGFLIRPATAGEGGDASGTFTGTIDYIRSYPIKKTFSKTGFGTVKAAIFIFDRSTTDGSEQADANFGMGFTDGSRQGCMMGSSEHGVANTDTYRRISNSRCAGLMLGSDGTALFEATWSSFPTDGIEIQWETIATAGVPPLITVVLIGGDDFTPYVGEVTTSGAEDGELDVTAPGFEPDSVLVLSIGDTTAYNTTANGLKMSVGMVDNAGGGVVTNISLNMVCPDAGAVSAPINHVSSQSCVKVPGAGFTPQFVMHCPTGVVGADSDYGGDTTGAGSWSVAVFNAAAANSVGVRDSDNVSPTVAYSLSESKPARSKAGSGTDLHTATFHAFDSLGWGLNYSVASGTGRVWPALAIGANAAATAVKDVIGCGMIPWAR